MRRITIILLLFLIAILTWFCQKRLFGKIHLKGTVIDWFSNKPIPVKISVISIKKFNPFEFRTSITDIDVFNNNSDGTFNETMESARSNNYFASFSEDKAHPLMDFPGSFFKEFQIGNKGTMDFGILTDMPHVFVCKVALTDTSSSGTHIIFIPVNNGNFLDVPPGINGTVLFGRNYTLAEYERNNHNYILNYQLVDSINPGVRSVSSPIGTTDTIYFNVSY